MCSSIVLSCALRRPCRGADVHVYLCWQLHVCSDSSLKLLITAETFRASSMKSPAAATTNTSRVQRRFLVGSVFSLRGRGCSETSQRPGRHRSIRRCGTKSSRMAEIVMEIKCWSTIFENAFTSNWLVCSDCLHIEVFSAVILRHNVTVCLFYFSYEHYTVIRLLFYFHDIKNLNLNRTTMFAKVRPGGHLQPVELFNPVFQIWRNYLYKS